MPDTCPGGQLTPIAVFWSTGKNKQRCICRRCNREYDLVISPTHRPRAHKGLPKGPDGSCPYRCDPTCDFDCYFPREEAGV